MAHAHSFYSHEKTIADTAQSLVDVDIPFYEANFHIYDNTVKYGAGTETEAEATAGTVLVFKNGNLKDIFFVNSTPGSAGRVVVVATCPQKKVSDALGL